MAGSHHSLSGGLPNQEAPVVPAIVLLPVDALYDLITADQPR